MTKALQIAGLFLFPILFRVMIESTKRGKEMTQYFIAETQSAGCHVVRRSWTPVAATTFEEAKKSAEDAQVFQSTTIWVGERINEDEVTAIAVKDEDDEWYGFFKDVSL